MKSSANCSNGNTKLPLNAYSNPRNAMQPAAARDPFPPDDDAPLPGGFKPTGIWKKGQFPQLDRHLELLDMRVRLKDRMPPDLLAELHALTNRLRSAG